MVDINPFVGQGILDAERIRRKEAREVRGLDLREGQLNVNRDQVAVSREALGVRRSALASDRALRNRALDLQAERLGLDRRSLDTRIGLEAKKLGLSRDALEAKIADNAIGRELERGRLDTSRDALDVKRSQIEQQRTQKTFNFLNTKAQSLKETLTAMATAGQGQQALTLLSRGAFDPAIKAIDQSRIAAGVGDSNFREELINAVNTAITPEVKGRAEGAAKVAAAGPVAEATGATPGRVLGTEQDPDFRNVITPDGPQIVDMNDPVAVSALPEGTQIGGAATGPTIVKRFIDEARAAGAEIPPEVEGALLTRAAELETVKDVAPELAAQSAGLKAGSRAQAKQDVKSATEASEESESLLQRVGEASNILEKIGETPGAVGGVGKVAQSLGGVLGTAGRLIGGEAVGASIEETVVQTLANSSPEKVAAIRTRTGAFVSQSLPTITGDTSGRYTDTERRIAEEIQRVNFDTATPAQIGAALRSLITIDMTAFIRQQIKLSRLPGNLAEFDIFADDPDAALEAQKAAVARMMQFGLTQQQAVEILQEAERTAPRRQR